MEKPRPLFSTTSLILDTNVLVSAFVFGQSARRLYAFCTDRCQVYTSEWILGELEDVLSRPKYKLPLAEQTAILAQVRLDAEIITPTNPLPIDSSDPDDNYVLQGALFVNADFLITGDKDLLVLEKIANTEIISPRTFFDWYMD